LTWFSRTTKVKSQLFLFTNSTKLGQLHLEERDWRRDAAQVTCPVLVIQGLEDLIPVASSREWAASFPEARLFTMAGSGHYPWIEDAGTFFPVALQFLREGWPQGAVQIS